MDVTGNLAICVDSSRQTNGILSTVGTGFLMGKFFKYAHHMGNKILYWVSVSTGWLVIPLLLEAL